MLDGDVGSVSMREFMDIQIKDIAGQITSLSILTDAKFVTFRTLIDSQADKVALALAAADKAVTKAALATEERFKGVNEFRGQLADQAATLATRREVEAIQTALNLRLDALSERVTDITRRLDTSEGKSKGVSTSFAGIVTAVGTFAVFIGIIVTLAATGVFGK